MKKIFLIIFLGGLFLPLASLATGIYKARVNNSEVDICYEGLVPCGLGKPYWINGEIVNGKCQRGIMEATGTPCHLCHLFVMVDGIIDFVLVYIIFPIAILLLVAGGGMFLLYAENPQWVERAKSLLTSVVIGLVIIFAAWLIVGLFLHAIGLAGWTENIYQNWRERGVFEIECAPSPSSLHHHQQFVMIQMVV